MDLLIVLTYAAVCVAIFKIGRIPLNKWTVPTAVLGGIVVVGSLALLMNYNHPFTRLTRQAYVVTPIVSEIRAQVISVDAEANTLIKAGTPLFTLDDSRASARVAQLGAELADTLRNSAGRDAGIVEAEASLIDAQAAHDQARRTLARYQGAASAFSRQTIDEARQTVTSADARVKQAAAALERVRAQQQTDSTGADPLVVAKQAQLDDARLDLANTVIRAPTDGYLTQLAVQPGMMAVPLPLRPLGVFLHEQQGTFTAAFRQQALNRIQPGYAAELVFDALPGRVFAAEVTDVLPAIAESQLTPSDRLIGSEAFRHMDDRALVTLRLTPDQKMPPLPLGINAQSAVYSPHFHHLSIMRKVLLRMLGWQHFLYIDH